MDCSPSGSSVHGILQARILEWGAISYSRGSSLLRVNLCLLHRQVDFFTTEPPGMVPAAMNLEDAYSLEGKL